MATVVSQLLEDAALVVDECFSVEEGDVVMAEIAGSVARGDTGGVMRMSNTELFVMRDGQIAEHRSWVIELKENDYR